MSNWRVRADRAIAHGALTNSKRPSCFVRGVYPTHMEVARGVCVWDDQGRRYIDFICALGTNLLGYAHRPVNDAVKERLSRGHLFSLSATDEVRFAEEFLQHMPFAQRLRVLKTGSDGCSSAIKIARAYQGVSSGSETVHKMLLDEAAYRISQERGLEGRIPGNLQSVRTGTPSATGNERNQAAGDAALPTHREGSDHRTSAPAEAVGAQQGTGAEQSVLSGPARAKAEALRNLWVSHLSSPSRGLLEAARREVALSHAPRLGAPKSLILSDGYHGHADIFVSLTPPAHGVPADANILPLTGNEDLLPLAAAVIVEPVVLDASKERVEWLQRLRQQCDQSGALLIYDETITGLRFPGLSVAKWSGVHPDLIIMGKALGNGMPISVVAGRKEVMEADYFVSSTFAGDLLAMAAARVVLPQAAANMNDLWEQGELFRDTFNRLGDGLIHLEGYATRSALRGVDEMTRALFMQEMCKGGVLLGPSFFWAVPHAEHKAFVLDLAGKVIARIKQGDCKLEGELPQAPYAQKVREQR